MCLSQNEKLECLNFEGPKKRQENGAFCRKDISGNVGSSISGVGTRKKLPKQGKENGLAGCFHIGAAGRWRTTMCCPYGHKRLNFHPISKSAITTDGDDYLCVIQLKVRCQCPMPMMMMRRRHKSKSFPSYLPISNDLHRALFGKSESVNGETIRAVRGCLEFCRNGGNSIYLVKFQPDTIFK